MVENFEGINTKVRGLNNMLKVTNAEMKFLEKSSGAVANNMATSGKMSGAFSGMLIPQQSIDNINKQFDDLGADAAKLLEDSLAVDFDFSALGEQFADLTLGDITPEKMAELQAAADGLNIDLNQELIALMDMMTGQTDLIPMDDMLTYTFETDAELEKFQRMIGLEGEFQSENLDGYLTYNFPVDESLQSFYDLIEGKTVTEGLDGYLDISGFETPDELKRFEDLLLMTGDFEAADFKMGEQNNLLVNAERGTELNEFMHLMNGRSEYILLYKTTKHQIDLIETELEKAENLKELRDMLKGEGDYEGIPGWISDLNDTKMNVNHTFDMANAGAGGGGESGLGEMFWGAFSALLKFGKTVGGVAGEGLQVNPAHDGGIFSGPKSGFPATLHGTEAVVPLPDGKSIPVSMAGGSGMVFNNTFNLGGGSSRESAREISRIIQDELRRNLGGASMRGRL